MLLVQLRVEVPEPPVMLAGVRVQVRPLGVTVEDSATVPVNPLTGATVMVELANCPGNMVALIELALIVKSVTWTKTEFEVWLSDPLIPVKVTV